MVRRKKCTTSPFFDIYIYRIDIIKLNEEEWISLFFCEKHRLQFYTFIYIYIANKIKWNYVSNKYYVIINQIDSNEINNKKRIKI